MKKRLLSILLALVLCLGILPASTRASASALDGIYQGSYTNASGEVALTLTIEGNSACFHFYNLPGRNNAREGKYFMDITVENNMYRLTGDRWIDQPGSYVMLDLVGSLNGTIFSGNVYEHKGTYSYGGFQVTKIADVPFDPGMAAMNGVYNGYYYARQGKTGLTLTITDGKAEFHFYNLPGQSNAAEGLYLMDVERRAGYYYLTGTTWVDRPSTYEFVDLMGNLNDTIFSGSVYETDSADLEGDFSLLRESNIPDHEYGADAATQVEFRGHTYQLLSGYSSWDEAKAGCASIGGYPATISDEAENVFLYSYIMSQGSKDAFFGLTRKGADWGWDSGEPMTYLNWAEEPDLSGSCGMFLALGDGAWNTGLPDSQMSIICEWGPMNLPQSMLPSQWADQEVDQAKQNDLIPTGLDANFKGNITRSAFCHLVARLLETSTGQPLTALHAAYFPQGHTGIFTDTRDETIRILNDFGIVKGMGTNIFAPNDLITREQAAALLCRTALVLSSPHQVTTTVPGYADDSQIAGWAYDSVRWISSLTTQSSGRSVMGGTGNNMFTPKGPYSYEQSIITMQRLFDAVGRQSQLSILP